MSNPYIYNLNDLIVTVYASNREEATKIFKESMRRYDKKVRAEAIEDFFKALNQNNLISNENNLIIASMLAEELKEQNENLMGIMVLQ